MFRSLLSAGFLALVLQGSAQSFVHQVVVLNEGYFDYFGTQEQVVPVTLGSYDPATGSYQTVATITGPRFGSDVLVHDGSIYVAADDRVLRYDLDTYDLLGEAMVSGVRKLAVWNDLLLITRGELGGLAHYFEVRDRHDLSFVDAIGPDQGLPYSVEDVLVVGDKAYLAVSNAFDFADLQGRIGVVDLNALTYMAEVDLGPAGLNPEKLMLHEGDIIAFNNTDFSASSISRISADATALQYTTTVSVNSSCAASAKVDPLGKVYFLEYAQGELARFDLATGAVSDTLFGSPFIYGLIEDPLNPVLYATTTDFLTSGELLVLDLEGQPLSSTSVGVAPGNLALDIRLSTGVAERGGARISVFPNPATDILHISGELAQGAVPVRIVDATGRLVASDVRVLQPGSQVNIGSLPVGVYTLHIGNAAPVRFTKG